MNGNIARGKWQQIKGALVSQWGRATGDHLLMMTGRHLQLVGGLGVACGQAKADIGRQIDGVQRRSRVLFHARARPQETNRELPRRSGEPVSAQPVRKRRRLQLVPVIAPNQPQ